MAVKKRRRKRPVRRKTAKRKVTKRKAPKRKSYKRKTYKRNAPKRRRVVKKRRKVTKRKTYKRKPVRRRKATKRKSYKRKSYKRNYKPKKRTYKRRRKYKKNVVGDLAKKVAAGFAGFLGGRLTARLLGRATFVPAQLQPYMGLIGTLAGVGLAYYLPKKVGMLKKYKSELLLGTGIACADVLFSSFAPESIRQYVGAPPPVSLPMGQDLNVYEAALRGWGGPPVWLDESGDWGQQPMLPGGQYGVTKAMAGGSDIYEAMAEYVQEPMGEYVVDSEGVLSNSHPELDAGVVSDGLFGTDPEVGIQALDGGNFDPARAAALGAAARVAAIGARAGRPAHEVAQAARNAAAQAAGGLSPVVEQAVEQQVARAVGRVQSFVPVQDPFQGAPMEVGPVRPSSRPEWGYGSIVEGGGIFAKSSIGG